MRGRKDFIERTGNAGIQGADDCRYPGTGVIQWQAVVDHIIGLRAEGGMDDFGTVDPGIVVSQNRLFNQKGELVADNHDVEKAN